MDAVDAKNKAARKKNDRGKLRIGDDWNAITIIALSQNNPLKAIAEFVENSIDAGARTVTIIRGKEKGRHYLKIIDDGNGIPCAEDGSPDFKYVATHICDSLKRQLKEQGVQGIQGEFGIGLLSFWTVGHKLVLVSSGKDTKTYQMVMEKGKSGYSITLRPHLMPIKGTQLIISPLLEGTRLINGEKIQRYLAAELRDRIKHSGVKVKIIDRTSRQEMEVQPRQYLGQLLHELPVASTACGDIYFELYLNEKNSENRISLFRCGTRVLPDIGALDEFNGLPWQSGYFEGIIDVPFLQLTPGTRDGLIRDEKFAQFVEAMAVVKERLAAIVVQQEKVEEEQISKNILRSVQKAIKEAVLALPPEDYDWFDLHDVVKKDTPQMESDTEVLPQKLAVLPSDGEGQKIIEDQDGQKQFFEFAGPLFSAKIQPASTLAQVGAQKTFRAVGMDKSRRVIEAGLSFIWAVAEGAGSLDKSDGEFVMFNAPAEPGLTKLKVKVSQGEIVCEAEAVITVVDALVKISEPQDAFSKGLPGYTLESALGKSWRSRYDKEHNLVIINSGHRDFFYSAREKIRKLRYICRLFAKELILHNFPGVAADQLLERLVELSLYTEDNLK